MKQKFLIISLLLNVFLLIILGYIFYAKGGLRTLEKAFGKSEAKHDSGYGPYYDQRSTLFTVLKHDSSDILFIGHSLMDGCEWSELFGNPSIKNRGINGEITEGILKQVDGFTSPPPRKIFLMTGTNDIGKVASANEVLEQYETLLNIFKERCPFTKVYLMSLLPINSRVDAKTAGIASDFNKGLKRLSKKYNMPYVDLVTPFSDQSKFLSTAYSNDGWHLMGAGYLKMKEVLEPLIKE